MREVMNTVLYLLGTGCQWRALPTDVPPRTTVFEYLGLWEWDRTPESVHHALCVAMRKQAKRKANPTAAIIDSQSVKSADKGGPVWILPATTQSRKSEARCGTSVSTRSA